MKDRDYWILLFSFSHSIRTTEHLELSDWFILFKWVYNVYSKCHVISFLIYSSQELLGEFTSKLGHFAVCLLAMSQWAKYSNSNEIITGLEAELIQEPSFVILVWMPEPSAYAAYSLLVLQTVTYSFGWRYIWSHKLSLAVCWFPVFLPAVSIYCWTFEI